MLGSTGHAHLDSRSQTKASAQRGHLPTHQTTGWSVKNLTLSATSSRSSWAQLSSQSTTSCRQQSHHQAVAPRKGQSLSYSLSLFMAQLRTHLFLNQCLSMTLFYKGQGLSSSLSLFKAQLRTHLFLNQCLSMTLFYKGQGLSSSLSLFKAQLRTHLFFT